MPHKSAVVRVVPTGNIQLLFWDNIVVSRTDRTIFGKCLFACGSFFMMLPPLYLILYTIAFVGIYNIFPQIDLELYF